MSPCCFPHLHLYPSQNASRMSAHPSFDQTHEMSAQDFLVWTMKAGVFNMACICPTGPLFPKCTAPSHKRPPSPLPLPFHPVQLKASNTVPFPPCTFLYPSSYPLMQGYLCVFMDGANYIRTRLKHEANLKMSLTYACTPAGHVFICHRALIFARATQLLLPAWQYEVGELTWPLETPPPLLLLLHVPATPAGAQAHSGDPPLPYTKPKHNSNEEQFT